MKLRTRKLKARYEPYQSQMDSHDFTENEDYNRKEFHFICINCGYCVFGDNGMFKPDIGEFRSGLFCKEIIMRIVLK